MYQYRLYAALPVPATDRATHAFRHPAPMRRTEREPALSKISLFRSGLPVRLGLAAALSLPLWLAIAWAVGA